jgi:heme exporter protein A
MTDTVLLTASDLSKVFNRRMIFRGISFTVSARETLLITGRNGSGKSTIVKMLAGLLTPTVGTVTLALGGRAEGERHAMNFGLVSPYLQMYDEFSAEENIRFAFSIRGLKPDEDRIAGLLALVGLGARKQDPVRTYSSGMKQRVKYAFALAHRPPVLMLDEPMANLDSDGTTMVQGVMADQQTRGILVVATNDLGDVERYDKQVNLNDVPRS